MNALLLLILLVGPVRAEPPDLAVLSAAPSGSLESARSAAAIVATFNQPMVALASPADMGRECPLRLEPKVAGRCRWRGTQVLAFEPERPLPPARRFRALIPAGLRSAVSGKALAADKTWEFETPRPRLIGSAPGHGERWIALNATLFLHFSDAMDPRKARFYIGLTETELSGGVARDVAVGVRRATEDEIRAVWPHSWGEFRPSTATVLAVKPAVLRVDRAYRLVLKEGLPAAEGELGLPAQAAVNFETYYAFRAVSGPDARCLPRPYTVSFSNPVRLDDVLTHTRIEGSTRPWPSAGFYGESVGDRDAQRRLVRFDLPDPGFEPDASYVLVVSSALRDVFGQLLGAEARLPFSNDRVCPQLHMAGGFGVLEQYLPARHPVVAVNADRRPLQKAFLADEDFVPFYRGLDWGCRQTDANVPEKAWDVGLPRNRALRTFIDIAPVFAQAHPARRGGMAFVQVQAPDDCWRKAVLDVTRVGLTLKSSPDSTLVWASYLKTGSPAAGVPVQLRGDDNRVLWRGLTNKQGLADAPGWKGLGFKDWRRWTRPNLWAFAQEPRGSAVLSLDWRGQLEPWRFNLSADWAPRPDYFRGRLFTERGVYRGGETVKLKGVVRRLVKGDWAPLSAEDPRVLTLRVTDSRGAVVSKSTVTLSEASSFDAEIPLSPLAPHGWWSVRVGEPTPEGETVVVQGDGEGEGEEGGGESSSQRIVLTQGFRVEAFKPAVFEVKAVPGAPSYLAGDDWQAMIEGWWLFGAPMAGEKASWSLSLEPAGWTPPGWEGFDFSPGWHRRHAESGGVVASGEAVLDGQGRASVSARLDPKDSLGALAARFEASVTSPERQRLFARGSSIVHRANLYLGARPAKPFLETGEAWSVSAVAVRPDGQRVDSVAADYSLMRRDWLSVERAGVAGRLEWVSEQRETVVASGTFAASASTWTWSFVPDKPGQYFFSMAAKDEAGRGCETQVSFHVAGDGEAYWKRDDNDLIEIVADKKSYKPGETARLMVKSPYARATALVTVEREGVISRWTQELKGGASVVRVPLDERAVPNVYVGIVALKGRAADPQYDQDGEDLSKPQAKFGYAALSVDPGGRRLSVEIASDKGEYRPGGTVNASLWIRDEAGRPVAGEATVYAVDEGVLNLTAYQTPDLWRDFYGERPLLVGSADSRQFVIGQRSFGEKGKNRGGGGGRGGLPPGVDMRANFQPTAFWAPTVTAGADGRAKVSFQLPGTLTRFRLMAVAHAGRRFGAGESRLTSSRPLMLRPSLPRLARTGDEFEGGVVVHNYSTFDSTVSLSLALEGTVLAVIGDPRREVFVPAGRAVEATWRCRATGTGVAALRFAAVAGSESDGLAWSLPIKAAERLERAATSGMTEGKIAEMIARPTNAMAGAGALEITVSPTALAGLREGARYLLEYPYGCLEQKLSRAFPVITGADLISSFGLGSADALKPAVQSILDRLGDYQHASGGYGYWPSPWEADPWLTAHALEAAALARREGYRLPEESIRRAVDWGGRYLASDKTDWAYPYSRSEDYAGRAYMTYALGLHGLAQPASFRKLFERRDQLPLSAKAWLLKAAAASAGEPEARALADDLLAQARVEARGLHFEEPELDSMSWLHETNVKVTAVALQALLEARGGFAGDEKAARWLVEERKAQGRWRTTAENSAGLRALQDFYRRYEADVPDFAATVKREGEASTLLAESFSGRAASPRRRTLALDEVLAGKSQARLELAKEGIGRLYYDFVLSYVPNSFEKPAAEGFEIERTVAPLRGDLRAGKRAVVTVTVRTKTDRTFVALEDPLPAGWEVVDPSFAVEGAESARALAQQGERGQYWGSFQRSEQYDDRVQVFADYMTAGEHRWSYLIQATTPGRWHVPAATVEEMYKPEAFGRTASGEVEVGH
ncbi:MAG: hypothetical protein HYZ74_07250 [Elusimicrobia bacterium]|nr:hypothetical protein [Elusimicrobiota bacterium]